MNDVFRVYLKDNKEIIEFGKPDKPTQLEFAFGDTLLAFLDFDIVEHGKLFEEINQALNKIRNKDNVSLHIRAVNKHLQTLVFVHQYFRILRNSWDEGVARCIETGYEKISVLPIKNLTRLQSDIAQWQRQIIELFGKTLDVMSESKPLEEKLAAYYERQTLNDIKFELAPLTTHMERLDNKTFVETIYPETIHDILNFFVRICIARQQPFRLCKSCGRYFAATHGSAEYCNRFFKDTGKTCKEVGSVKTYQQKLEDKDNLALKLYNRAYKTHFARIKYRKITRDDFQAWAKIARDFRDKVLAGDMDLKEFEEWLKR
jgi:hypothetical protein